MILPLADKVVLKPLKSKSPSGIVFREPKDSLFGTVIAIGCEVSEVKPKDTVIYRKDVATEINYQNEIFYIVDKDQILAVIANE